MRKTKIAIQNVLMVVGFGTLIFVPALLITNGLDSTLKSVLLWVAASLLYGVSFGILDMKVKYKTLLHIVVCFLITIATRILFALTTDSEVNVLRTIAITLPIFIGVYIALFFFMKFFNAGKGKSQD